MRQLRMSGARLLSWVSATRCPSSASGCGVPFGVSDTPRGLDPWPPKLFSNPPISHPIERPRLNFAEDR